jgi:predicted HAD superfamily Cof-like phosphohydrolase
MTIVYDIAQWFKQAVPEPTDKSRAVQIGCHYEEAAEMAAAIGNEVTAERLQQLGTEYKQSCRVKIHDVDLTALLDSLCDQIVTAIGVAHMFDLNIHGALDEVSRSNFSKFVDGKPLFNEHGKIMKGPHYTPPDLTPFV